jgi:hypothetical protein
MYPDSVENCERLIKAIDRDRFAVHYDPVSLVNSPSRYFGNAALISEDRGGTCGSETADRTRRWPRRSARYDERPASLSVTSHDLRAIGSS